MNNNGASVVDYLLSVDIGISFSCSTDFRYTNIFSIRCKNWPDNPRDYKHDKYKCLNR